MIPIQYIYFSLDTEPGTKIIGPYLPPSLAHLRNKESESVESDSQGPSTASMQESESAECESSDDDDVIGPLPADHPKALRDPVPRRNLGDDKNKEPKKLQREEWMLIPPRNKSVTEIGFGARKFLMRAPEEPQLENDDVPEEEESTEKQMKNSIAIEYAKQYDEKMDNLKTESSKKRPAESLLEIHRQEMKKKKV